MILPRDGAVFCGGVDMGGIWVVSDGSESWVVGIERCGVID
jgi:hypothetical protein